jgi:hypothetical protein
MAMFVVLGKFTAQGAKNLPDVRKIAEGNQERAKRLGAKIHGWYLTQGQYDFVVLAEAPDAETRDVIEKFDFDAQIGRLDRAKLLYLVLSKVTEVDLHRDKVTNVEMGYL